MPCLSLRPEQLWGLSEGGGQGGYFPGVKGSGARSYTFDLVAYDRQGDFTAEGSSQIVR